VKMSPATTAGRGASRARWARRSGCSLPDLYELRDGAKILAPRSVSPR
jgi:hypothetical protein